MTGRIFYLSLAFLLFHMALPHVALAFQEHGAREGLYVHLLAHICFGAAMLWLFLMIKNSDIWQQRHWRFIAWGAALLTFWNVDTFAGHIISLLHPERCLPIMHTSTELIFWVWYVCKLDHLVCVTAMIFFYLGLKQLLTYLESEGSPDRDIRQEK